MVPEAVDENDRSAKVINDPLKFDEKNMEKITLGNVDDIWKTWMNDVQEQKGANLMRKNTTFLEYMLKLLQSDMANILNKDDDRALFLHGLRILSLIVLKSDENFSSQIDILKNKHLPTN